MEMKNLVYLILSVFFLSCATEEQLITNGTVIDIEGNEYPTVIINGQEWMAENLRTATYNNGDPIPNITDFNQWSELATGAWVYYNNDSIYETPHGKLYNWYAATDSRNSCPTGWHIPSTAEWRNLIEFLGSDGSPNWFSNNVAGGKMKSTGLQYWNTPNSGASNESGFSGHGSGTRRCLDNADFFGIRNFCWWWSIDVAGNGNGMIWNYNLMYDEIGAVEGVLNAKDGISIRCVKD
jgi:uncharacterized protein (TIGR02145 family)